MSGRNIFAPFIKNPSRIACLFLLAVVLAMTLFVPSLLVQRTKVSCDDFGGGFRITTDQGTLGCFENFGPSGRFSSFVIDFGEPSSDTDFYLGTTSHTDTVTGVELAAQGIRSPVMLQVYVEGDPKSIAHSSGIGTVWSSATRATAALNIPAGKRLIIRREHNLRGPSEFIVKRLDAPTTAKPGFLMPTDSQNWNILAILLIALVTFAVLSLRGVESTLKWVCLLTVAFLVLTIVCGMPFGSASGWYDTGDDKSYVHWAFNLGYLRDPFLYHSNLGSWAQDRNHHQWGTGLLLAPFILPISFLKPGLGLGTLQLGLMSFGIICLAFASIVVSFLGFSRVFPRWIAAFVSFLPFCGTSLVRWTYQRNIFSHVPESFALSIATYGFIGRYLSGERKRSDIFYLAVGLFFASQVRHEDILLFALPFTFEALSSEKLLRRKTLHAGLFAFVAVFSEFVLRCTNYFTDLKSFRGANIAARDFHYNIPLQMLSKQGLLVLFDKEIGFFYWLNIFPWVALLALWWTRRKWKVWLPLLLTATSFILLCIMFEYPNGCEWQNRFLLKLNPIVFGGVGFVLFKGSKWVRSLIVGGACAACIREILLYRNQLPDGMAFYLQQFGDHSLAFPQLFPGSAMYLFYLPLIVFASLATLMLITLGAKHNE